MGLGLGQGLTFQQIRGLSGPAEFITNGGFSSGANWVLGSGWIIAVGVATYTTLGGGGNLQQNFGILTASLEGGSDYVLSFDLVNITAGTVTVTVRAGLLSQTVYSGAGSGTIVVPFTAGAVRDTIRFVSSSDATILVDNISIVTA